MKFWTLSLLLQWSTCLSSCTAEACTNGSVRVTGVRSTSVLAGRVDLCSNSEWKAVCENLWDRQDSMVVCRQFGYPAEGAQFCFDSCLGRNDTLRGVNSFACSGSETRLDDCRRGYLNGSCVRSIGVICYNSSPAIVNIFQPSTPLQYSSTYATSSPTPNVPSAPTRETTPLCYHTNLSTQEAVTGNRDVARKSGSIATMAVLGGVALVLFLVVVGVIIGWTKTCIKIYRSHHGASKDYASAHPNPTIFEENASYNVSGSTSTSIQENICYNVVDKKALANSTRSTEYSIENNVCYGVKQETWSSTEFYEDFNQRQEVDEPDYY